MKTKIIGIVIGVIIVVVIFLSFVFPKPDLQERCEKASWPPEGNCSIIPEIEGKEFCEKCKELMGEEKFTSMIKEEMGIIEIEPAGFTQLTFFYHASDPDWSPDGSRVVFEGTAEEGEDVGVYLINVDGTGLTRIGSDHNPSWSPVDNRILLREDREEGRNLILIDLDKGWGNKVKLASQINEQASWSPDGKKIAYSSSAGLIWVMNSDGSGKTSLTTDKDGHSMVPSFSYDGSKIVYLKGLTSYAVGGEDRQNLNEIWTMNADGSNKQKIYAPSDSTQLIFQRAWNKDNKILFMRTWYRTGGYPQIWVMNSDGSDAKLLVSGEGAFGDPVWDNTGTKVAGSKALIPSMRSDIWTFSYEEPESMPSKTWEKILDFFK